MSPQSERTIFDLLQDYNRSLRNMRAWLDEAGLDELERVGIADAWQSEMRAWFHAHGYCFGCNRSLERCDCDQEP